LVTSALVDGREDLSIPILTDLSVLGGVFFSVEDCFFKVDWFLSSAEEAYFFKVPKRAESFSGLSDL
jgi:hypothetical protein